MYSRNIVGLGAVGKKPRLKSGDTIVIESYIRKSDIYGNPYNAGSVYYQSGKSMGYKKLGEWQSNWGGKDMARQNAMEIVKQKMLKPYGKKGYSSYELREANVRVQEIAKEMPIRKFDRMFK